MRGFFETYKDIQKLRIAIGNQLFAKQEGKSEQIYSEFKSKVFNRLVEAEKSIVSIAKYSLRDEPIWNNFLKHVKGIGPVFAMGLVSYLGYCEKFPTIAKLIRYAGYATIDGVAEKRKRGEKCHFNPRLKTLLWLIGESFVKQKSEYRAIYEKYRQIYAERWGENNCNSQACKKIGKCTDKHKYEAAKRKAIKEFLKDYYRIARKLRGVEDETFERTSTAA